MQVTIRRLSVGAAALLAALALAACGGGVEGESSAESNVVQLTGKPRGTLTISQWPLYIDDETVSDFEKATGVHVRYLEEINDDTEFFGKMQPLLARGESGGRSLFVISDFMAVKMNELGYLLHFDKSAMPNVTKNLLPSLRHPEIDPNRDFTVPWQSGMTGLVVRTDLAPDVSSVCDIFDPRYKGKVDVTIQMRDTLPLTMKCMGIHDPNKASEDEWMAAIEKIEKAAKSGQFRRFSGADYGRDLTSGDAVIAIGYSGDAVQLQADNPHIKFVMPEEGCLLWSGEMVIPRGAPNATAAEAFINYVYDPAHQAKIGAYVNFVSPVEGTKEVMLKTDPALAKNRLIFPSAEYTKNCVPQPQPTGEMEKRVTAAFNALVHS